MLYGWRSSPEWGSMRVGWCTFIALTGAGVLNINIKKLYKFLIRVFLVSDDARLIRFHFNMIFVSSGKIVFSMKLCCTELRKTMQITKNCVYDASIPFLLKKRIPKKTNKIFSFLKSSL